MKTHLAQLVAKNLYIAVTILILLTPYVKGYSNIFEYDTIILNGSSSRYDKTIALESRGTYKKEIYKIKNVGYGKLIFVHWVDFSLPNGKMPTCIDEYLKVTTGYVYVKLQSFVLGFSRKQPKPSC